MESLEIKSAAELVDDAMAAIEVMATPTNEPETESIDCRLCAKEFERPVKATNVPKLWANCPECLAHEEQRRLEIAQQQRWEGFCRICPKIYLKSDNERLPAEAKAAWEILERYTYCERGIILAGPTGRGKTRIAWRLLKRLYMEEGKNVTVFNWHDCLEAVMDHDKMRKWLSSVHNATCLLIDDFGKNKFTDRVEAEIFDLVEYRTSRELPLFITTNETPETLKARMSADRGEPMLRRLHEFCDVVTF